MAFDAALGADAVRGGNDSEALQPAQPVNDCFSHGAPIVYKASITTISAETVSAASGAAIDR